MSGFSKILILLTFLLLLLGFYWYEYRPTEIRAKCEKVAKTEAVNFMKTKAELDSSLAREAEKDLYHIADKESYYNSCLLSHGLELK